MSASLTSFSAPTTAPATRLNSLANEARADIRVGAPSGEDANSHYERVSCG